MKRLLRKKAEEEDEMSFDEVKQESLDAIKNMKSRVNEWTVRDILIKLTQYGFYQGEQMASIDENAAREICDQIEKFIKSTNKNDEDILFEIYDKIYHFAH